MEGKIFRISDRENPNTIGYEYIKAHKDRLEPFSLEESSIDLQISCFPRIVAPDATYGEVVYRPIAQYFVKESDTSTTRILVLQPLIESKDNAIMTKIHDGSSRYGTGFIPGISDRVIGKDGKPTDIPRPTVQSQKKSDEGDKASTP